MKIDLYNSIIIIAGVMTVYGFFSLRDIFKTRKEIFNDFEEISTRNKITLEILNPKTRNHHDECDFQGVIRRQHGLENVRNLITENRETEKNYLLLSHLV